MKIFIAILLIAGIPFVADAPGITEVDTPQQSSEIIAKPLTDDAGETPSPRNEIDSLAIGS